jgi:hypothetical protein
MVITATLRFFIIGLPSIVISTELGSGYLYSHFCGGGFDMCLNRFHRVFLPILCLLLTTSAAFAERPRVYA